MFVDSHFCINAPKYVTTDDIGNPCLTTYALHHMDECCLLFDLSIQKSANKYGQQFYTECVLYRDSTSDIVFEARYSDSKINDNTDAQALTIQAYNKELASVLQTLPRIFTTALISLMEWKNKSVEALASDSGVSDRTIRRMRNEESYETTVESIIAICVGLQLPPEVSYALIDISTCSLNNSEKHLTYRFILNSKYTHTIYDCNALLRRLGYDPLTKEI